MPSAHVVYAGLFPAEVLVILSMLGVILRVAVAVCHVWRRCFLYCFETFGTLRFISDLCFDQ